MSLTMPAPRTSFEGKPVAEKVDAPAGLAFFPLGGGASTPVARKTNETISAQAGNPNFPRSVLDEGRQPVDDIGMGDNEK